MESGPRILVWSASMLSLSWWESFYILFAMDTAARARQDYGKFPPANIFANLFNRSKWNLRENGKFSMPARRKIFRNKANIEVEAIYNLIWEFKTKLNILLKNITLQINISNKKCEQNQPSLLLLISTFFSKPILNLQKSINFGIRIAYHCNKSNPAFSLGFHLNTSSDNVKTLDI